MSPQLRFEFSNFLRRTPDTEYLKYTTCIMISEVHMTELVDHCEYEDYLKVLS